MNLQEVVIGRALDNGANTLMKLNHKLEKGVNLRLAILTVLTLLAFAGNSLLCRVALKHTTIDAASFTTIRLISGAIMLWIMARLFRSSRTGKGNWLSGLSLFAYAACFSFAYVKLPAGTGALLLFGAVQTTMIGHGIWTGERLLRLQIIGIVLALGGLVGLLLPGISAPPLVSSILMLVAGFAWGMYSLCGRRIGDPIQVTAGNFTMSIPFAVALSILTIDGAKLDSLGVGYAVASGAVASAIGYVIWYSILPSFKAVNAATIQLSVPVIAALGGIIFLGELMTVQFALASIATLGGVALVIFKKKAGLTVKEI